MMEIQNGKRETQNSRIEKVKELQEQGKRGQSNIQKSTLAAPKESIRSMSGAVSIGKMRSLPEQTKRETSNIRNGNHIVLRSGNQATGISNTKSMSGIKGLRGVSGRIHPGAGQEKALLMRPSYGISKKAGVDIKPRFLTNQSDSSISFSNLQVSPYEVEQLLDVKIEQKINEHGTFYFKGLLSDEKRNTYAETAAEGTNVVLRVVEESGNEYVLFQGVVHDVEIKAVQGVYYIEVHAVSYSYLLDIEKKSRSFQDKKMSYEQLVNQVTSGYPGAGVADMVSNGMPTNKFIMQHMETDWEFLKRLASHFNTGLVCDIRFDKPMNYFGIPQIQTLELDCFNYSVKKDMQKFKRLSENGVKGLHENDFIYYEVETDNMVYLGSEVWFQNKKLYIAEITSVVDRGIFVSRCILTPKKGLSHPYQYHDKVAGGSFNGHIIEIQNDRVKVSLDIDQGHDPGELCFFPYSTIYSSQDGSGWYCMPEIGDTVRIYFPDGEEDHAYAISSVHEQVDLSLQQQQNAAAGNSYSGGNSSSAGAGGGGSAGAGAGGYSGQRDDPSVKSLRSKSGKEIRLTPDGVYIIADGTTITLTDDNGVMIMSENNIEFKSDKSIIMSAEEDVNIIGTTGVDLMCSETASVKMKENVEIIGQEVKAN